MHLQSIYWMRRHEGIFEPHTEVSAIAAARLGFALLALILMLSASCSLYLLSAVRAFVNGESLWSKAQKDAIYSLSATRIEGNPIDFAHYQRALQVPRGVPRHMLPYDKPCAWTWRAKA
jgi:hypothetical protein